MTTLTLLVDCTKVLKEKQAELEHRLMKGHALIDAEIKLERKAKLEQQLASMSDAHYRLWLALQVLVEGWTAWDVVEKLKNDGLSIFWSEVLKDRIAFVKEGSSLPEGVVAYTESEVNQLAKGAYNQRNLRLIHEAKKLGATVVEEAP